MSSSCGTASFSCLRQRLCSTVHRDATGVRVRNRVLGEPAKTCARWTCRFYLWRLAYRADGLTTPLGVTAMCVLTGSAGHGVRGLGSGVGRAVVRWATLCAAARFPRPRLLPGCSASAAPPPSRCERPQQARKGLQKPSSCTLSQAYSPRNAHARLQSNIYASRCRVKGLGFRV